MPDTAPSSVHGSPAVTPTVQSGGTQPLRCGRCGWTIECLSEDRERFERDGCPVCGGGLTGRIAVCPGDPRRRVRRRARSGTWVEVRRTEHGRLADLAVALVDVSVDGVGVWLEEPVRPGEEVEVTLAGRGLRLTVRAEARWCAMGVGTAYRAGLRLRQPLTDRDLADLAV